jgi:histone H3/H4
MAERPEDLNLPVTVVQRIIKEAVSFLFEIVKLKMKYFI